MYAAWMPPTGDEERLGKKILKAPMVNDGRVHEELE